MLKETSLCMGCMNDKTYDGPCRLCGYSDSAPCIPTYLSPKTFLCERYIVGKLLNYNGEGAVYMGYDTAAGVKVTIKEFMPDTLCTRKKGETDIMVNPGMMPLYKTYLSEFADLNRSLQKARGMAHIQTVLDVFAENNTCYTVFEFINGISLKTYLANSAGALSWEQVKELFPPILTTLSLVHSAGIIHRGISPSSIFVTDKMELKLAEFSISAARTTNTEIACEIYAGYAAPEQYTNEVNGTWTDVYGIAAVLYRVLTGTNPQEAIARTNGSMLEPMMINRNVPAHISKVIMCGLRLSTETRIRSVNEFVDRLFAQPRYEKAPAKPDPRELKRLKKQKKERVKTLAVLSFAGVVLIAFAVVFAMTLNGAFSPVDVTSGTLEADETSGTPGSLGALEAPPEESAEPQNSSLPPATSEASAEPVGEPLPEANIRLPDFTGRRYENTVQRYDGTFTFIPQYEYSDDYSVGLMYDQSIEEGTLVAQGVQIEVKVSKGRKFVPLPDYDGVKLGDYVTALSNLNIRYSVKIKKTNDVENGIVAGCSKEVGDLVNVMEGETITVYEARNYKETEPAPEPEQSEPEPERTAPRTENSVPDLGGIPVE